MTIVFELSQKRVREVAEQVADEYLGAVADEIQAIRHERDLLREVLGDVNQAALEQVDRLMAAWHHAGRPEEE